MSSREMFLVRALKDFVATLKSSSLVMLLATLFGLDLLIPDFIPFVDEILLFAATVLAARWKGRKREEGSTTDAEPSAKPRRKNVTPRGSHH